MPATLAANVPVCYTQLREQKVTAANRLTISERRDPRRAIFFWFRVVLAEGGERQTVPALMRCMERYRTIRAYSAGGVVFRLILRDPTENSQAIDQQMAGQHPRDVSIEVALVGRSHPGIWALPKGTPRPGETIEQVAVREVQEETGLQVRLISYLGSITYSFVRSKVRYHKQVRHFLLEAIGGDTALHDQEYDVVEWFPLPEASRRLTYQNEVNILYQAEATLQRWLQNRPKEGIT